DPRPLPRLDVDAPALRMTFGVNTSPLSGREGKYVTSRQIKARLDREVLGNVSIEVHPTTSGDTFEVRGRGELQLAVLIEQMRREGFELTVSRPEVILRTGAGEVTHRTSGVLVSDRTGTSNAYGLFNLQERSELFIGAGVDVYEGMIVGENARSGDLDVNATKEKKLTNIRTHAHDEALRLTPP